jgi:acetylornithine deacetylase/succinyl-diaminopimelate desuccinylase-like protein
MTTSWQDDLKANEHAHLDELLELLRMPSVSTDPAHKRDVAQTAQWVADRLGRAGVPDVAVVPSAGHPSVIGRWHVADDQPTILIYGHYDVQPEEPVALWQTPAFEPAIRDGKIYARGSSDMKGNLLTAVQGVEALARANGGKPPINVSFIFEGEEEIGSPHFRELVEANREKLKADAVLSADGGQEGPDSPSLSVGLKGLAGVQIDLRTANTDLHSGMFGAGVPNAVQAMVQLAATFHDAEGHVLIDGFYDTVKDLTPEDKAEIGAAPFDEDEFRQSLGLEQLWGEAGYTTRERQWGRPTADFNGIWGGFQGDGVKTVTPSEAHLKVTCRLVPDQRPEEIVALIRKHVAKHCPPGATAEVVPLPGSAYPFVADRDNRVYQAAKEILTAMYGKEPLVVRSGGTVPATGIFKQVLGIDTISYAWSMPGSGAHAPNEWYRIEDFNRGREGYARLIEHLRR